MSRRKRGTFPRGKSGNPKGRPKGIRNGTTALFEALERDAAENGLNLFDFAVRQARELLNDEGNPQLLIALLNKAIPNRSHSTSVTKRIAPKASEGGEGTGGDIAVIIDVEDAPDAGRK